MRVLFADSVGASTVTQLEERGHACVECAGCQVDRGDEGPRHRCHVQALGEQVKDTPDDEPSAPLESGRLIKRIGRAS